MVYVVEVLSDFGGGRLALHILREWPQMGGPAETAPNQGPRRPQRRERRQHSNSETNMVTETKYVNQTMQACCGKEIIQMIKQQIQCNINHELAYQVCVLNKVR